MTRSEQVLRAFQQGANCVQSIVSVFAGEYGVDHRTAQAAANGFGSGMAVGSTCGIVAGATLAIEVASDKAVDNKEAKPVAYRMVKKITKRFKDRYGTTTCCDLMGRDMSDPSQAQKAREKDVFNRIYSPMIGESVTILKETLQSC